jgi:hypothetical protein
MATTCGAKRTSRHPHPHQRAQLLSPAISPGPAAHQRSCTRGPPRRHRVGRWGSRVPRPPLQGHPAVVHGARAPGRGRVHHHLLQRQSHHTLLRHQRHVPLLVPEAHASRATPGAVGAQTRPDSDLLGLVTLTGRGQDDAANAAVRRIRDHGAAKPRTGPGQSAGAAGGCASAGS